MGSADLELGAAFGAEIQKDGEAWTLVLVRDLRHPPRRVWSALTDPEQLRAWAPFDADRSLAAVGTAQLTTVGAPQPMVSESRITRADAEKALEFTWGEQSLRWELEPREGGTRLTLWHNINKSYVAMGAAGWHLCFAVLGRLLDRTPSGRLVGPAAMGNPGWQRLHAEYAALFNLASPKGSP
jgi:uncharacterized protein YndB with AHSA1/START domain